MGGARREQTLNAAPSGPPHPMKSHNFLDIQLKFFQLSIPGLCGDLDREESRPMGLRTQANTNMNLSFFLLIGLDAICWCHFDWLPLKLAA